MLRWGFCAGAVLLAHATVLLALWACPDYANSDAGAPVVLIELAPLPVAPPAPESELAPGPHQLQAESREKMREETPEEKPRDIERVPDLVPAPNPAVTLPTMPEPPKERPREEARQEPAEAAPVPTAPPATVAPAARPAAPQPGHVPRPASAALVSWQHALVAQLERNKRYPPAAGGAQGTARLAFRIDRRGHLLESRIMQSTGSAVLDEETLALARRAQPFPSPPADVTENQLSFVVPIRYAAAARR